MDQDSAPDGVQRVSDTEVRLVREGRIERSVLLEEDTALTVTRISRPSSPEDQLRDAFEQEVRELQDAWEHIRRCAFCQKTSAEVQRMIAGPSSYICDECVGVCSDVLAES